MASGWRPRQSGPRLRLPRARGGGDYRHQSQWRPILGRRFENEPDAPAATSPAHFPTEFLGRVLSQLPAAVREQAAQLALRLLPQGSSTPGYFDVLANSINIM